MRVLRRELGVDPEPTTRELYQQALKSEASPAAGSHRAAGLHRKRHADRGPEREWTQLLDCWSLVANGKTHLAVIMGEPGIGKEARRRTVQLVLAHENASVARARCYAAQGQLLMHL